MDERDAFRRADRLFASALDLPVEKRAGFLDAECENEPELRALVARLLDRAEATQADLRTGGGVVGPQPAADITGTTLDRYRIVREIGRGGMGVVYEAQDERLRRQVAIKVLTAGSIDEPTRDRFLREARAAAALNHPNIVAVHDAGDADGRPYIVMELVPGSSLEDAPPATIDDAVEMAEQVCLALEHAHARGLVHRDLKPANVLALRHDGGVTAKLTDLGIALVHDTVRMTQPGTIAGTPSYMAPEQALGKEVDGRADLYALGVMLYGWTTGQLPFVGDSALATLSQHIHGTAIPPRQLREDLPAELDAIILRLLEKEPDARYASAAEVRSALRAAGPIAAPASQPAARGRDTTVDSLAVIPFANVSNDAEADYLSDGLTDSLIDNLSHIPRLRVMARSTVSRFADGAETPETIGNELGVRAVLTGRLTRRGDDFGIQAELVDATDGTRLWGKRFKRPSMDLLSIEEAIAREICDNLRFTLTDSELERVAKRETENPEAHQAYLRGRHVWARWKTPEGMHTAIGFFERAIELDPLYARAFAGLADSYSVLGNVKAVPPAEAYPKARTSAEQGLAIDGELAELHTSLGFIHRMWEWDWAAAEASYRRAIELNPAYATAYRWYSHLLSGLGRHEEAIAIATRALELEPMSLIIQSAVGDVYFYARRYEEAIAHYQATLAVDPGFLPGHTDLARAYELAGRYDDAIAEFKAAEALVPEGRPEPSSGLAHVYAQMGRRNEALAIVDELIELSKRRYVSSYGMASIHACLGDVDAALDWLERAHDEHDQTLVWVYAHPRLDPLRHSPRYRALVGKMNFPALNGAGSESLSSPRPSIETRSSRQPEVRFCATIDGMKIAYAVHGTGVPLVRVLGWFTHVELEWNWPDLRFLWEELAEHFRVVRYDGRGMGLSDHTTAPFTEETRYHDLRAVLDSAGIDRCALFGLSEGGWTAAEFARRHPDRVSHLIMYGAYARGWAARNAFDHEEHEAMQVLVRKAWGRDNPAYQRLFADGMLSSDASTELLDYYSELQRVTTDADTAARYIDSCHRRGDGREWLKEVTVPTLVLHRREDAGTPIDEGRLLAATVPGARFVTLAGDAHELLGNQPGTDDAIRAIVDFVS